jgi:Protein of unknown function (DUF2808)
MLNASRLNSYFLSSQSRLLGVSTLLLSTLLAVSTPIAAVQASDDQSSFTHAPRLIRSASSSSSPETSATYQFTLKVPEDAGAPLKAVNIKQQHNSVKTRFDASQTRASQGERFAKRSAIPLTSIGGAESAEGDVTVVFDQPVQPGSTVTISLKAVENPAVDGTYLFGVTAYPVGDKTRGISLGYGRLQFDKD